MEGTPALRFDKSVIQKLPTPIAIPLQQLSDATQARGKNQNLPLNVLWHVCDAVESLLRLLVFVAIAELHDQGRLDRVAAELAQAMDRPTLGQWRRLLERLAEQLRDGDTMLAELKSQIGADSPMSRFFSGDPKKPLERDDPLQSFLALRNRLAHGAGLTHEPAADLLDKWKQRADIFLRSWLWMSELHFSGREPGGRSELRGLIPVSLSGDTPAAWGDDDIEIVSVSRAGRVLLVWPMICYGLPRLTEGKGTRSAIQLYSRRSAIDTLQYTPLDTREAYWSFSDERATKVLDTILMRTEVASAAERKVGAVAKFYDELLKDSKQMIGRESQLRRMRDALKEHRGELLWLDGEPGSGKSTLMAKFVIKLLEDKDDPAATVRRVLPFRFKVGDGRCSADQFFQLIETEIDPSLANSDRRTYSITSTLDMLKTVLAQDQDCVVVLDGLDEIDSIDKSFISDVCLSLVSKLKIEQAKIGKGRVTWVCAGRKQLTSQMLEGHAIPLFPEGLKGLSEQDVRAMLLDRIGKARENLLKQDDVKKREIGRVSVDPSKIGQLDDGEMPAEILAICKSKSTRSTIPRVLPIARGKKWLIDDNDNHEMFFVDLDKKKSHFRVHADRLESPYISEIIKRSDGLPIYLRCVINDIMAGGDNARLEPFKLPVSLEAFYQKLMLRCRVSDIASLLTHLVCLIAVARDSINDRQLVMRARSVLDYPSDAAASKQIATALLHLSPMLRSSEDRLQVVGHTIYHKSFRDYLDPPDTETAPSLDAEFAPDESVKRSILTAKRWICDRCSEVAELGIAEDRPFDNYAVHHGIVHLLEFDGLNWEYNGLGRALQLHAMLVHRDTDLTPHKIQPTTLTVMAKRIADAALDLEKEMRNEDDPAARRRARERGSKLRADSLLVLIHAIYETGTRKGAIRVLAELHDDWNTIRQQLHSPYDMVLRVDTGEVLADLWEDATDAEKPERMKQLVAMTLDPGLEEREIAWYALAQIFLGAPEQIALHLDVLKRWAESEINVERMILSELVLGLAGEHPEKALALERAMPPADYPAFWQPMWDYHRIEIDSYRVKMTDPAAWPALARDADDPSLVACIEDARRLQTELSSLRARDTVRRKSALARLLTPEGYAALGRDASKIKAPKAFKRLKELLEGPNRADGLDILRVLTMHPMWQVSEAVASVIERLVESDIQHMKIIDDLLDKDAHWRVSYAAIDAAYNVAAHDNFALFESAIILHGKSKSSRVLGICADDFLAWLRMSDAEMRKRILGNSALCDVLKFWVAEAKDYWLLEYVYLILRLLKHDLGVDIEPYLAGGVASQLAGEPPFYECKRDELLLRIERNEKARTSH